MPIQDDDEASPRALGPRAILGGAFWSLRQAVRTNPRWVALAALASLLLALIPAAQVSVVAWVVESATGSTWTDALVPVLVLTALVGLSQVVSSAENLTGQRASLRLRSDLVRRTAATAAVLTPRRIADPPIRALVEGGRNSTFELARGPISVISALSAIVAALALGAALLPFSAVAAGLVVLALVPGLITFSWAARMQDEQFDEETRHAFRARYLVDQLIDLRTARELATFGTGPKLAARANDAHGRATAILDRTYARLLKGELLGGVATAVLLGGALIAVLSAGSGSAGLMAGVLGVIAGLQATRGAGFALGDVISVAPKIVRFRELEELADSAPTQHVVGEVGSLEAHGLSITYPGADRPAVQDASLRAEAGEMIALVGVNGAGKTTLVSALMGLVDLDQVGHEHGHKSGVVEIDDADASTLGSAERLSRFGLVTQEFGRYEMTVRDAVALGTPREDLADEEIWQALDAARAGDLVRRLPGGLDTMLGPQFGGVGLSGGQWQRIALARIHLRGAGIRVLDEPTSAIDAEAEQEVFAQLRETAAGHITIVVSHRAWTLRGMDRIHVLEEGRIVETGTYEELLAPGTRFAEIFAQQLT
ncbi:ATP-binding protein of ABC transporter [Corynebacterium xerosis]|uniref:ATP-binding cassette domain-containing protein n=1 Tax=Brachybacterium tyrofermentans TaxID=47848 RepID=UPI000A1AF843|nr:ATP-binding protein of ABC transporter [Corynebacterium xerosis]